MVGVVRLARWASRLTPAVRGLLPTRDPSGPGEVNSVSPSSAPLTSPVVPCRRRLPEAPSVVCTDRSGRPGAHRSDDCDFGFRWSA